MAAPMYSPATGPGTAYTDPQTGAVYVYQSNGTWAPSSSGSGSGTTDTGSFSDVLPSVSPETSAGSYAQQVADAITKANATSAPAYVPQKIDFNSLTVPSITTFEQQVAQNPDILKYYD